MDSRQQTAGRRRPDTEPVSRADAFAGHRDAKLIDMPTAPGPVRPADLFGKASLINPAPFRARVQRAQQRAVESKLLDVAAVLAECDELLHRHQQLDNMLTIRGTLERLGEAEWYEPPVRGPLQWKRWGVVALWCTRRGSPAIERQSVLFCTASRPTASALVNGDVVACGGALKHYPVQDADTGKWTFRDYMMVVAVELLKGAKKGTK